MIINASVGRKGRGQSVSTYCETLTLKAESSEEAIALSNLFKAFCRPDGLLIALEANGLQEPPSPTDVGEGIGRQDR